LLTTLVFFLLIAGRVWMGTICYVDLGAVGIACPLGVAQVMAASRTFVPALVLAGRGGMLFIVLFGRAFCGWICPGRWIFNRGPASKSLSWRARAWVQRAILGGVVGVAWVCHTPVFCTICPAGVACPGAIAVGTGGSMLPALGWLGALVGAEWASGYSWCQDLCPLGTAISQLSRLNPFLKVKSNPERCRPCTACQKVCPVGLNLARDTDFASCTKCFACQSACPRGAVEIKLFQ
jgi:ferredoxin-type protein NapH